MSLSPLSDFNAPGTAMHAMVLTKIGAGLEWPELPERQSGPGEIR